MLKNKLAVVGKKEAEERNRIETSLRHELLVGNKKKQRAPVRVVLAESVEEGGEEVEEEQLDEHSSASEPGISKVVRFEWRGDGDERVGQLVVIWDGQTEETVESVPGVMIDAPEKALKMVWDRYAQDEDVLNYIDKMARSKLRGLRVVPHWRSITHYAARNKWEEKTLAAYPEIAVAAAVAAGPLTATMPTTAMPLPLVSPTSTTPTTTTAPCPSKPPSPVQKSKNDSDSSVDSTVTPCRVHQFNMEIWSKDFVTNGCLKDRDCGGCERKFVVAIAGNLRGNKTATEYKPSASAPAWVCVSCNMPVCDPCKNGLFNVAHSPRRSRIGIGVAM